jgi:hypothetical protein
MAVTKEGYFEFQRPHTEKVRLRPQQRRRRPEQLRYFRILIVRAATMAMVIRLMLL